MMVAGHGRHDFGSHYDGGNVRSHADVNGQNKYKDGDVEWIFWQKDKSKVYRTWPSENPAPLVPPKSPSKTKRITAMRYPGDLLYVWQVMAAGR